MGFANIFDAARNGTVEDVRYFVEQEKANVNAKENDSDSTVLRNALISENVEVIKYLVMKGANIAPDFLFDAVCMKNGSLEIVKLFVENGADVNYRDSGMFPLLIAAGGNNLEVAKFLVSKGADINMVSSLSGYTPLEVAKNKGNAEMVKYLASAGAGGGNFYAGIRKLLMLFGIGIGVLLFIQMCVGVLY